MTKNDTDTQKEGNGQDEAGIEYRATIRFPRKDYEFLQKLIDSGEYTNVTEIVRDAVKRFRLEWSDMETVKDFMPMAREMRARMMPMMRMMMQHGCCEHEDSSCCDEDENEKEQCGCEMPGIKKRINKSN